ncbi:MAG: SGNH/GDSL hydrolase family protein [Planctomycetota bacterium]
MGFRAERLGVCAALTLSLLLSGQSDAPLLSAKSSKLPVVSLLGASVTAGYSVERPGTARLQKVLEGIWETEKVSVRDRSDMASFIDPLAKQEPRLRRVLRDEPDLVLAIDFMFWFGYGRIRGDERRARLQKQEDGFALLDMLDCPILVGDYPDMRGADSRVLRAHMIPAPEILTELNKRLHAWIAKRDKVHLFPLASWVEQAVNEGEVVRYEDRDLQIPPLGLLQRDRLHANRLGMAMMGYRIAEQLGRILPDDSPLRPRAVSLEGLVERTRSEIEVSELEVVEPRVPVKPGTQRDR